jgi:hypothetical protein
MLRLLKRMAWLSVLAAGLPGAQAFVLLGPPNEAYEVPDLGYMVPLRADIGAPKNIGEEYRRNTPVLYYAFDQNFLDYFGSDGVRAVDQAFAILNSLTNVSSYSADLSEVPLNVKRMNQTAGALNLQDVKSATLSILVEQLGLADPTRYTWGLHDRLVGTLCPGEYLVVKRNLEIVPTALDQLQYSSYVNTKLYTYSIHDYCANPVPPGEPLSEAVDTPVEVLIDALQFAPVSSFKLNHLVAGQFITGLTRDDVAGLRYLLRAGNVNWEDNPANSIVFVTNNAPTGLQLLVTSNLTLLAAQSLTNDDATLLGLYPTLAIVPGSTVPTFTNLVTTNLSAYFTNSPWDPVGTPPHLVYLTNYSTNVTFVYTRSFANVVTNTYYTKGYVTVRDTSLYFPPSAPVGYFTTNVTTKTMLTNMVSGDYYIIPTTSCGVQILSNVLTTVVGITNTLNVINTPTTNTISGNFLVERDYITWFTNQSLAIFQVLCVTNEPSLRRGIEKITFVKSAYDSLLGKLYNPQTNYFTMTTVTNSTNWVQTFQRVATAPDFLFTAQDLLPGPAAGFAWGDVGRNIVFNSNNALPGLAGPGTIDSPTTITFNKSGPVFYNSGTNNPPFLDELSATRFALWASYDDSTNAPIVYPNGTSIASVESQMMMQVTSVSLPPAQVGRTYTTQLTGTGGSGPPYKWELEPLDGNALPIGLSLTGTGLLSGIPAATGIYSFFVRMDDRLDTSPNMDTLFTVWQVTLTVLP